MHGGRHQKKEKTMKGLTKNFQEGNEKEHTTIRGKGEQYKLKKMTPAPTTGKKRGELGKDQE